MTVRLGACLSLSGRYARFGAQAAAGLRAWQALAGAEYALSLADDASDPARLAATLPGVIAACDLVLGPYSTGLMRAAGQAAREAGRVVFNHGGAGDDVQQAAPGRVVSVLAPTSRYARAYVQRCAGQLPSRPLRIVRGPGGFARQVAAGALSEARRLGLEAVARAAGDQPFAALPAAWDLFSVGRFEDDVALVNAARRLSVPPRMIGSVAAGVRDFASAVRAPDGIYGIAQWLPAGDPHAPAHDRGERDAGCFKRTVGPGESEFIAAYRQLTGTVPDYVAAQAAATAAIAVHCADAAGGPDSAALWAAAVQLRTTTLLGPFAIEPGSGRQTALTPVLVRWHDGEPRRAGAELGASR